MNITRLIVFWIAMLTAVVATIVMLRGVLLPFVAGMVLAYLLNPLASQIEQARDDLGQWRAYADNGRGFAIGFAPRLFKTTKKPLTGKAADFVGLVKYTPGCTRSTQSKFSKLRSAFCPRALCQNAA